MSHVDEGTLHALVDDELAPSERATVEAHLATCGDCARQFAEATAMARQVHTLLGALDDVALPPLRVEAAPTRAAALASVQVTPLQQRMRTLRRVALAASVLAVAGISYRVGVTRNGVDVAERNVAARSMSRSSPLTAAPSVVEASPDAFQVPSAPTVRAAPRGGPRAEQEVVMSAPAAPLVIPAPAPMTTVVPQPLAVPPPTGAERREAIEGQVAAAADAADRASGAATARTRASEPAVAARRAAPSAPMTDARAQLGQAVVAEAAAGNAAPAVAGAAKVSAASRTLAGYQAVEDVTLPPQTRRRYVAADGTTLLLVIVPLAGESTKPTSKPASEYTVSTAKGRSTVRWQMGTLSYELQGVLAPDSLVKLATQLR